MLKLYGQKANVCLQILLGLYLKTHAADYKCKYNEFLIPGSNECVKCPPCYPGQEVSAHCGFISGQPPCQFCHKGITFKDVYGRGRCRPCRKKCPKGKRIISPCDITSDMVCSPCKFGYFETSDGSCEKCSYCCDGEWDNGIGIEAQCYNAGLGQCSCSPQQDCHGDQSSLSNRKDTCNMYYFIVKFSSKMKMTQKRQISWRTDKKHVNKLEGKRRRKRKKRGKNKNKKSKSSHKDIKVKERYPKKLLISPYRKMIKAENPS